MAGLLAPGQQCTGLLEVTGLGPCQGQAAAEGAGIEGLRLVADVDGLLEEFCGRLPLVLLAVPSPRLAPGSCSDWTERSEVPKSKISRSSLPHPRNVILVNP